MEEIVVPLDGSDFANRALRTAKALSAAANARLRVIGIAPSDAELAWTYDKVHEAVDRAGLHGIDVNVRVDPHPVEILLATGAREGTVLCLATHDRPDPMAKALRAVGSLVLQRSERPVLAVGPHASAEAQGSDVVVAIDGVTDPEPLLSAATDWATRLGSGLRIVTVYEPVPPDLDQPGHYTRDHGPAGDPDDYVKSVRERVAEFAFAVDAVAIADPVGVATGLEQHLADVPARVLVLGGRHPRLLKPSGATAEHLLRNLTLPVLLVNHPD